MYGYLWRQYRHKEQCLSHLWCPLDEHVVGNTLFVWHSNKTVLYLPQTHLLQVKTKLLWEEINFPNCLIVFYSYKTPKLLLTKRKDDLPWHDHSNDPSPHFLTLTVLVILECLLCKIRFVFLYGRELCISTCVSMCTSTADEGHLISWSDITTNTLLSCWVW